MMMNSERLNKFIQMFNEHGPIGRYFGMKLSFTDEGHAVINLPYNPNLDHAFGDIHGGVYATMLDCAGWFTAAAAQDNDYWIATSEMSVHFLGRAKKISLRAVGRLIKRGKRQHITEMHLYDGQDRLVAHATGTFAILPNIPMSGDSKI